MEDKLIRPCIGNLVWNAVLFSGLLPHLRTDSLLGLLAGTFLACIEYPDYPPTPGSLVLSLHVFRVAGARDSCTPGHDNAHLRVA